MEKNTEEKIKNILQDIYEDKYKNGDEKKIMKMISKFKANKIRTALNEEDNFLIIYPDAIRDGYKPTLQVIKDFLQENADFINNIHLLPMFEYTSDDGYAVTDYLKIRKECGSWKDVENLGSRYGLILDLVINHVSSKSLWLKKYLEGENDYRDFFIEYDAKFDFSNVVRPRNSDLFHEYTGKIGRKKLWTTFSEDQVDLNYANYKVLISILSIIGEYLTHGARGIRLDAACYIWKESGKSCCNMDKTHKIIQLIRCFMDAIAPGSVLLSQTNVEADENVKYFGNGSNEAGLIYQFALPPLVLHSILNGNAKKLSDWATGIDRISDIATYFNFLGCHDGIGLRPVKKILTNEEIKKMADNTLEQGGKVYESISVDGTAEPYELNISYLNSLTEKGDTESIRIRKMLAAHVILISLLGVPAVYYQGLFGSENDLDGMKKSGIIRRINRQKFDRSELKNELAESNIRAELIKGIGDLLKIRKTCKAFDPYGYQEIVNIKDEIFAVKRWSKDNKNKILAIINLSKIQQDIEFGGKNYQDIITGKTLGNKFKMEPYEYFWLRI